MTLHNPLQKNFTVNQVLWAEMWKSTFSFAALYLGDITHKSVGTFCIGPVIAVRQVM